MELILLIYSKEVSRAYRVFGGTASPDIIRIPAHEFLIHDTLEIPILNTGGTWHFSPDPDRIYQIYDRGHPITNQPIQNQSVFQIKTVHRDYLCVLAFTDIDVRKAYEHYSIKGQTKISLGKLNSSTIQYDMSGFISNVHMHMIYVNQQWIIEDKSSNGLFVNGEQIKESRCLEFGDMIDIFGLRIILLGDEAAVLHYGGKLHVALEKVQTAVVTLLQEELPSGQHLFHRAPRVMLPIRREVIELDVPPAMQELHKQPLLLTIGPALTMAIPMLLGFAVAFYSAKANGQMRGAYLYTGLITAVASALLGTVWAVLNVRNNQSRYMKTEQMRQSAYRAYLSRQEQRILDQYEENANALRSMYPSAREACRYDESTHVLWNRNVTHEDFLTHRMGLGEVAFQAEIRMPKEKFEVHADALKEKPRDLIRKYQTLYHVPICIDFAEHRLVGVIEEDGESGILYNLAVQFAVSHSYTDVKLVFFLNGRRNRNGEDRAFIRWLPHVWSEDKKIRFVDFGEGHSEELIYELCHIFRRRMETEQEDTYKLPHYVVLIEHYKRIEDELPLHYLFAQAEQCGITTVLFADRYEELPNMCTYILQKSAYFTGAYDIKEGEMKRKKISMDVVLPGEVAALSRRLSGIETNEPKNSAKLPEMLTLFELFGICDAEELCIEKNWSESRPDLYLKAAVGIKAGNSVCCLDVHEKAHGPHGLIAGMTGSGKSEVLQTYIISMAVRYRPEEVGFFLIDYKGGGMANLFLKLPHLIGHISNLSGAMIHRAMVSIKSENKRRQEIFNQNSVNNIHEYIRLYRAGEVEVPLPHIMIIIDEFAELKKEEPDFMKELISVAQVGRSLGVHLILATQKPSGTVDDNIRSNARFRLCLRVQDRQDSTDMLHKADAAYITQAGRAYLQVGNDELYELFQSAWSSAPYEKNQDRYRDAATLITLSGRKEGYGHDQTDREGTDRKQSSQYMQTQLEAVIECIREAAARQRGRPVSKLWLPMLPDVLCLAELTVGMGERGEEQEAYNGDIVVPIGRYDDPKRQLQDTLYFKLTEGGHHVVCGMVTSGKSTFLQTLLYALVTHYTPKQLNLYIIDCSSHSLSPFQYAPHTGGFMGENDLGKMKKTIHMLHLILAERKELLQGGSYRQYVKSVAPLPAVVLVIDNYAILKEKTDEIFEGDLMEFSRIGEGYGLYLIVTAAGFGAGDVTNRMAENFRTTICLRMTDKYQYAGVLRVLRVETCPENGIYGRGLAWVEGEVLEFQTALALPETEDYARMEQIQKICRELMNKWGTERRARQIPCIPKPLTEDVLVSRMKEDMTYRNIDVLPIGYYTETADLCVLNYEKWYCLTIGGRRNTGKTNFLKLMIQLEGKKGTLVYIIDSSEKKLRKWKEREDLNIAGYYTETEELFAFYEQLGEVFKERNQRKSILQKAGEAGSKIYRTMCEEQRILVVIGNLTEWTIEHYVNQSLNGAEALVFNLLERGSLHNIYFAASYRQEKHADGAEHRIFEAFTGYRTGIRLGGYVGEERILDFSYVTYSEQDKSLKQGHGMIPHMESGACQGYGQIVIPYMD